MRIAIIVIESIDGQRIRHHVYVRVASGRILVVVIAIADWPLKQVGYERSRVVCAEASRMQMVLAFHFEEVRVERIHTIGQVVIIAGSQTD